MKAVKAIGLQWTDAEGKRWGTAAQLVGEAAEKAESVEMAFKRLREVFDDWQQDRRPQ